MYLVPERVNGALAVFIGIVSAVRDRWPWYPESKIRCQRNHKAESMGIPHLRIVPNRVERGAKATCRDEDPIR